MCLTVVTVAKSTTQQKTPANAAKIKREPMKRPLYYSKVTNTALARGRVNPIPPRRAWPMLLMSFTGYRRSRRSVQRAVADFLIIRLCCEAFGALQKNAENLIGAALGPSAEPPTERAGPVLVRYLLRRSLDSERSSSCELKTSSLLFGT
jgi:hypothetical protein